MQLYPALRRIIENLDYAAIPQERKKELQELANLLQKEMSTERAVNLNFICTHNSRRSQLCQVWAATAISYFRLEGYQVFSGGTETTAFHPNAVKALEQSGFRISTESDMANPVYTVSFSAEAAPIKCFSKPYHEALPDNRSFVAILTCEDAEANCPFIPEARQRFSLKYEDPKKADGSEQETAVYMERNRQIATELFYLFSKINVHGILEKTQLS